MGLKRQELRLGSAVRRVGGRQLSAVLHPIVSITNDSGITLVTTADPHGITDPPDVPLPIVIAGTGVYDGPQTVITLLTPTTFYIDAPFVSSTTGGTWRRA